MIDYKDSRPIYEQIVERFQTLILKGVLEPGAQLPSVRSLAMEISINPNTIQRAYTELERRGFIYSVKGRGSYIADTDWLLYEKREELLNSVMQLLKEAKEYGIGKEDFIRKIDEFYREDRKND